MASCRRIDIILDDQTPHKWILPLTEDAFPAFLAKGSPIARAVFRDGSFFSPMLFGKFFDPSDAFPLWDFEADVLLSNLRRSGHTEVDWFQTDRNNNNNNNGYVLRADLPGVGEDAVQICVEKGKVLEISGQWKPQRETIVPRDWKSTHWWEHGYVRRIELPENADWKKAEASIKDGTKLEIIIPFKPGSVFKQEKIQFAHAQISENLHTYMTVISRFFDSQVV